MDCIICDTPSSSCIERWPEIQIVQCPNCGHVFWNGETTAEQQRLLYSEDYFKEGEYSDYQGDKHPIQRNFKGRKRRIVRYKTQGNLLEIGSAYGFFLELMRDQFNVVGFEVCKEAAEFARNLLGLPVLNEDFLTYDLKQRYDVICMWDVIEHLQRPDLFLARIASCAADDAYLFLTTGDISALVPRIRGPKWRLVHPPTHIHYFGRATIRNLLEKFGFEVVEINHPGTWRSCHQFFASVFGLRSGRGFIPGSFYLNLYDIMCVVARKRSPA
jgi:hypothetical protein